MVEWEGGMEGESGTVLDGSMFTCVVGDNHEPPLDGRVVIVTGSMFIG